MTKQSDQTSLEKAVFSVAAVEQTSEVLVDLEMASVNNLVMLFNSGNLDHDTLIAEVARISAYRRITQRLEITMNKQISKTERELGGPNG